MALATSVIMPVAIFYEILWIDLFPAGTYVPPNGTLSVFLVCCLVYLAGNTGDTAPMPSPSDLLLPLVLAMPAADCASRVEMFLRRLNDARHDTLVRCLTPHEGDQTPHEVLPSSTEDAAVLFAPQRLMVAALVESFLIYVATFALCGLVLFVTFWAVDTFIGHFPQHVTLFHDHARASLTWPMLWFAALVGALLALRIKKAYVAYGATVCLVLLSFFFLK